MAKQRLVIFAKELREDDYDAIRLAWQQAMQDRQRPIKSSRRINCVFVAMAAIGIIAAVGFIVLLVQ